MSSKKLTCVRNIAAGIHLPEAQNPYTPHLYTLLHTAYMYIHTGKGGELNQREVLRGNSSQSWIENTNTLTNYKLW